MLLSPAVFEFLCYQYHSFQKRSSHQSSSKFNQKSPFKWNFVITNIPYPILGADFVHHFDVLIDLGRAVLLTRQNTVFVLGDLQICNDSAVQ
ncbi:hypothetical protein TKK_0013741 [Trichogramma kaykai]